MSSSDPQAALALAAAAARGVSYGNFIPEEELRELASRPWRPGRFAQTPTLAVDHGQPIADFGGQRRPRPSEQTLLPTLRAQAGAATLERPRLPGEMPDLAALAAAARAAGLVDGDDVAALGLDAAALASAAPRPGRADAGGGPAGRRSAPGGPGAAAAGDPGGAASGASGAAGGARASAAADPRPASPSAHEPLAADVLAELGAGLEAAQARALEEARAQARDEGHRAGVDEGLARGRAEGRAEQREAVRAEVLAELDALHERLQAEQAAHFGRLVAELDRELGTLEQQLATAVTRIALELGRQVVRAELELQPQRVAQVAEEAVQSLLASARHIRVRLHPDDVALVEAGCADLLAARGARLVASPAIERGGCRVESDAGTVDARIGERWAQAVQAMGGQTPWQVPPPAAGGTASAASPAAPSVTPSVAPSVAATPSSSPSTAIAPRPEPDADPHGDPDAR